MTPIPDRCRGTGRIIWSDDSYASYNEPCGGCTDCLTQEASDARYERIMAAHYPERGHHESEAEYMERGRSWEGNEGIRDEFPNAGKTPQVPEGVKAVLTVSVDVTGGRMTDNNAWRPTHDDWEVTLEGRKVCLRGPAPDRTLVCVDREGLAAAIKILEDYHG